MQTPVSQRAAPYAGRRRACNLIASVLASRTLVPPLRGRFTHVPASDSWIASGVAQSGISASTDVLESNWLAGIAWHHLLREESVEMGVRYHLPRVGSGRVQLSVRYHGSAAHIHIDPKRQPSTSTVAGGAKGSVLGGRNHGEQLEYPSGNGDGSSAIGCLGECSCRCCRANRQWRSSVSDSTPPSALATNMTSDAKALEEELSRYIELVQTARNVTVSSDATRSDAESVLATLRQATNKLRHDLGLPPITSP